MRRIPQPMLSRMAAQLSTHDRDEMAIPSYQHPNPALRWMAWHRVEVVSERLGPLCRQGTSVVDYGCGTGVLFDTALRYGANVIGVDPVLDSARLLVRDWDLDVTLMSPREAVAKIEPASIDLIVAAEVLEHVEPLSDTLDAFTHWLRPGGRLLVSLPTETPIYQLGRRIAGFSGHYHHANARTIHHAICRHGFSLEHKSEIPLPGPLSIYWVAEYVWR